MSRAAPGALEHVRAFVNTADVNDGLERLDRPEALAAFLAERGWLAPGLPVSEEDRTRAIELREALRDVLRAHHDGGPPDPDAAARLEAAARRADVAVCFDAEGVSRVEPLAGGVEGALGHLLALVHAAQADGTWARMKVCAADDCHWAFYDGSRNHSGRWCSMGSCGNRAKVRGYRERARRT